MDDGELIRAVKEGSPDAFGDLLARYEKRIFNAVSRLLGDQAEAEDVVQDAFLKAYRALPTFHFESGFYTWLYRIAINAAVDARKKRRRRPAVSLEDENADFRSHLADQAPGPEEAPSEAEMIQALRIAIEKLPEKFRTILILREYDGLSYEELAQVLEISKGTVESRLFRARMKLRTKMEKFL